MSEIQTSLKMANRPADLEVRADAFVYDWYFLVNETSYAYTVIFPEIPQIKFLGGFTRQFKPGFPFTALVSLCLFIAVDFRPIGTHFCQVFFCPFRAPTALELPDFFSVFFQHYIFSKQT